MIAKSFFTLWCMLLLTNNVIESTFSSSSVKTRRTQSMRPLTSRNSDSRHVASTSTGNRVEKNRFKEMELEPMKKTKTIGSIETVNLDDISVSTHSGNQINPARDAFLYASSAAIGSAVGMSAIALHQQVNTTTSGVNTTTEDIISNPIG